MSKFWEAELEVDVKMYVTITPDIAFENEEDFEAALDEGMFEDEINEACRDAAWEDYDIYLMRVDLSYDDDPDDEEEEEEEIE